MAEAKEPKKGGVLGVFRDILYGMSSHEMTRHAVRTRARLSPRRPSCLAITQA